jgi:hypothetical protein
MIVSKCATPLAMCSIRSSAPPTPISS